MQEKLNLLKEKMATIWDLSMIGALMGWDQQTYMPPKGAEERGEQMATLSRLVHEMATSDEVGKLLDELVPYAQTLDPDSDDARLIKLAKREYDKQTRVPAEKVAEYARVTTMAQGAWVQARSESNFALFQPHLEKIVELRREYASYFAPYDHVYDPLLDDFEPGLKTAEVQEIFARLRPQQVELIQAIATRPQVDDSFLHLKYDDQKQWNFGVEVATRFGYDWQAGRQDRSAHPFTTSFGIRDVRITTRVIEDQLPSALFGTMHETGHALYQQGIDWKYRRSALGGAASLAVHESQSRMWENLVGRSRAFWRFFYPRLQEYFPQQLGNVSMEAFYKAINKVEPSFIRVEADEATYNLHIMLRLELEIALMEGSLEVKHLPEAWNTRMKEYLGITPPNDRLGVLQDIHWSGGMIGYFPTYALGNLISVQLWEKILQDIPNLEEQIERGEFSALLGWLREKIHRHGSKYEPQELVEKVTGSKIDPQPYIRYLNTKYRDIYGF
uniref:Metal-dependent carboxypeptidase n=1 Tax=Bellilinea caldifistulae TaxID=360411 RepID=A0A7C4L0D6_9CHLR